MAAGIERLEESFRPAVWLPGAHLQTIWGRLTRSRRRVSFRRELLETPDGDEIVLDHVDTLFDAGPSASSFDAGPSASSFDAGPSASSFDAGPSLRSAPESTRRFPAAGSAPESTRRSPAAGRVLVLHGLEGSSYSVYVQGLLEAAARRGLRGIALNFRSCARDPRDLSRMLPNRRPRLYHSGETGDLDFVARTLAAREPGAPLYAVGVSIGGNVLLKWLGERPDQSEVAAAAALSTPFDLSASADHLESAVGRLYVASFLGTLRRKAIAAAERFPEAAARIDVPADAAARAPSGSSTTPPRRPFTGSPAPTSTIAARAPSRFFRESRHRRSASPPRTIRSCRPSRSSEPAPSCPPRSSSASLATGAISASWRALFRGGRRTGPRRRRSSGWSGGNPGAKKSRGAADPLRRLSSRSRRSCCGSRDARLSRASWRGLDLDRGGHHAAALVGRLKRDASIRS